MNKIYACIKHIIKPLLILLTVVNLSACVPAAIVAGVGAGAGAGAVMYNKRDVTTMVSDNDASNAVLKAIDLNGELKENTHIVVTTVNQIMLIAGQANTEAQRHQIYQIASEVPKLKRIYNEITIEPPTTLGTRSTDTWITTKVKTALLAEKGLQSNDIKVITENAIVYLMGIVTPNQANLAANAASQVSRVKKVVKVFEYQQ